LKKLVKVQNDYDVVHKLKDWYYELFSEDSHFLKTS